MFVKGVAPVNSKARKELTEGKKRKIMTVRKTSVYTLRKWKYMKLVTIPMRKPFKEKALKGITGRKRGVITLPEKIASKPRRIKWKPPRTASLKIIPSGCNPKSTRIVTI